MTRAVRQSWILLFGLVAGCPANRVVDRRLVEPKDDLDALKWLTGSWVHKENGNSSEEHWTAPRGGLMLGMNRTVTAGKTAFFEYLRIEKQPDGIFYIAHPKARSPGTPFKLVENPPNRAVFENPQHDFPQRIIYWREGDVLHARTEGPQNGRPVSEEWSWQRLK